MIIELRGAERMRRFEVDCGYLQEDEAFEVSPVLANWASTDNRFIARAAGNVKVGDDMALDLGAFIGFAGELALGLPDSSAVVIDLNVTGIASGDKVKARLAAVLDGVTPPHDADNPGFLPYALPWFSRNRPVVRLYLMDGVFWIEAVPA